MCEQHWVHCVNFHSWQTEQKPQEYAESFPSISEGYGPVFSHTFPLDFFLFSFVLLAAHILADAQAKKEVVTYTLTYFFLILKAFS